MVDKGQYKITPCWNCKFKTVYVHAKSRKLARKKALKLRDKLQIERIGVVT